tara:strand:+ start:2661 stop:2882 length:222 start_codon:yes stop_codon:yes gene_type:complete
MQIMVNDRIIDDDELILDWRDVAGLDRAHFILLEDDPMVVAICGRNFPARDVIPQPDENPRCKSCARREEKAR